MNTHRTLFLLFVFSTIWSCASASTVISTSSGGFWHEGSSWVGGFVPDIDDDVVIEGAIFIEGTRNCANLLVNPPGILQGAQYLGFRILAVSGDVHNAGTITNGSYALALEIGGSLHNAGSWTNSLTTITGSANRQISQEANFDYSTKIQFSASASGDLTATSAISNMGDVIVTGGRLVLQQECPFTLENGVFSGEMMANGNEMHFVGWSYLNFCTIDDVILVGNLEASTSVIFTTRVTVMDRMQNRSGSGGATVHGDLINYGLIRNVNYSFLLQIHGDLQNFGTIANPILEFVGTDVTHHISMSEDAVISAQVFLPEFQTSTLIADTPIHFADTISLGEGTLILEPGSSLEFTNLGTLREGTVLANGNEISIKGTGSLSEVTVDAGVIAGSTALHGDCIFTNGLTVSGYVSNWDWSSADVEVHGLLDNSGTIENDTHQVRIVALGDVQNSGMFSNASLTLAGTENQAVGVGEFMMVEEFVIESLLTGENFQWFHNGTAIEGATESSILLGDITPQKYGEYYCVSDGENSRMITIEETLGTSGVPGMAGLVQLEQNYPNPFNPATEIAFSLQKQDDVSLVIYDLAGREVQRLLEGTMEAGRHSVTWQPRDIASGTYFYGLKVGGSSMVKKCVLLK